MPPSGYSNREANAIVVFLRSCSEALDAEAARDQVSHSTALTRECRDIQALLQSESISAASCSVLNLTSSFYEEVNQRMKEDPAKDFFACVDLSLQNIEHSILDIHVPPGLHLRIANLAT